MSEETAQWGFSARAKRRRRSLVPLAGLMGVALIATAIMGLFGVYRADRGHEANLARLERMTAGLDTARRAQIHFKKQVQEWKNILLRGDDPALHARYREALRAEATKVEGALTALAGDEFGPDLPRDAVGGLLAEHARLNAAYERALADRGTGGDFDGRAVDRGVRGIDRDLDDRLDALADRIAAEVVAVNRAVLERSRERYAEQQRLSSIGLAVTVSLMGLFLVLAMRAERKP